MIIGKGETTMKKYENLEMVILSMDVCDVVRTSDNITLDENELPIVPLFSK